MPKLLVTYGSASKVVLWLVEYARLFGGLSLSHKAKENVTIVGELQFVS